MSLVNTALQQLLQSRTLAPSPSRRASHSLEVLPSRSQPSSPGDLAQNLSESNLEQNTQGDVSASDSPHPNSTLQKRPGDDLSAIVPRIVQRMRLDPKNEKELLIFAKLPPSQQLVYQYAQGLRISQKLEKIQPADTVYEIPKTLLNKFIVYGHQIILCPDTPSYHNASGMLMAIAERHPKWGYTEEIKKDERKTKVVLVAAQGVLTTARSHVKSIILKSIGKSDPNDPDGKHVNAQDIVTLTRACIAKLESSRVVTKKTKADIVMCAQFALLRQVLLKSKLQKDYWPDVDIKLAAMRRDYKDLPEEMSRHIQEILEEDIKLFGDVNLVELANVVRHHQQLKVEAFAVGRQAQLDEPIDDDDNND